jgi:adenosylhomocysteine nucleosidase
MRVSDADIVVLTALEREAIPFQALLMEPSWTSTAHRTYLSGSVESSEGRPLSVVVWPIWGMGNARSAAATQLAIAVWNPSHIVLSGITGGVKTAGRRLGDVLVPSQVVGYELGKLSGDDLHPRFDAFRASPRILNAARTAAKDEWWRGIHVKRPDDDREPPNVSFGGVLASGEKVVASDAWSKEFSDIWPLSVGVEMEGLGVAVAAFESESAPSIGVIKAVSDWADATKNDGWQFYAASAAAAFAVSVLRRLQVSTERPQPQVAGSPLSTNANPQVRAGWGKRKVLFCRGLTDREQRELADCLEIEPHHKQDFSEHAFCSDVWDHLVRHHKLSSLPAVVEECLDRPDLARLISDVVIP